MLSQRQQRGMQEVGLQKDRLARRLGSGSELMDIRGEAIEQGGRIHRAEHEIARQEAQPGVTALGVGGDPEDRFLLLWHGLRDDSCSLSMTRGAARLYPAG